MLRMSAASGKWYAVAVGHTPGVYPPGSWNDVLRMVKNYSGAIYKGFNTESLARAFVNEHRERGAGGGGQDGSGRSGAAASSRVEGGNDGGGGGSHSSSGGGGSSSSSSCRVEGDGGGSGVGGGGRAGGDGGGSGSGGSSNSVYESRGLTSASSSAYSAPAATSSSSGAGRPAPRHASVPLASTGAPPKDLSDYRSLRGSARGLLPSACCLLRFDGSSRGNPGAAAFGAALWGALPAHAAPHAERPLLLTREAFLGPSATNNEAEWAGLIAGLRAAGRLGVRRLLIEGDSTLVLKQVAGEFAVRAENLQPFYKEAHAALAACMWEYVGWRHIFREDNVLADHLANAATDSRHTAQWVASNAELEAQGLRPKPCTQEQTDEGGPGISATARAASGSAVPSHVEDAGVIDLVSSEEDEGGASGGRGGAGPAGGGDVLALGKRKRDDDV